MSSLTAARMFLKLIKVSHFLPGTARPVLQALMKNRNTWMMNTPGIVTVSPSEGSRAASVLTTLAYFDHLALRKTFSIRDEALHLVHQRLGHHRLHSFLWSVKSWSLYRRLCVYWRAVLYNLSSFRLVNSGFFWLRGLFIRVLRLGASFDVQEFSEVCALFVAARPSFVSVVEYWDSRVMNT